MQDEINSNVSDHVRMDISNGQDDLADDDLDDDDDVDVSSVEHEE